MAGKNNIFSKKAVFLILLAGLLSLSATQAQEHCFGATRDSAIEEKAEKLFSAKDSLIHPDSLYKLHNPVLDDCFRGEVGQDLYDTWYAYFAAKRMKDTSYNTDCRIVSDILTCVNNIFHFISGGGTGFGHEAFRIPAYAAYYVYESKKHLPPCRNSISAQQMEEVIDGLWQLASMYNKEMPLQIMAERLKRVDEQMERLKVLVTNEKYLYCLSYYMEKWAYK